MVHKKCEQTKSIAFKLEHALIPRDLKETEMNLEINMILER